MDKQKKKHIIVNIILIFLISFTLIFNSQINRLIVKFSKSNNMVIDKDALLVHFLSVGQGDGMAVNLPDGKVMLIDTGLKGGATTFTDYIDSHVLNNKKSKFIDYLVLTHADVDHSGGLLKLMKTYKFGTIYIPKVSSESIYYNECLDYLQEYNLNFAYVEKDIDLSGNSYQIKFYGPLEKYTTTNETSPVIKVTYQNKAFLFTGDISESVEADLIAEYGNELNADVIKVAHHGSKNSSSEDFVKVVSADYAVISVGEGYIFGHPSTGVINNFYEAGAKKVLRTDLEGNIMFAVSDNYDTEYFIGDYVVIGLGFNYIYFVIIIDVVLIVGVFIIILKDKKSKVNK